MRLLAVADTPERLLYDAFDPEEWRGRVDLVLACGDLDREYLEFLVTELAVPVLYVPGNHDTTYRTQPPEGCDNLDERLVTMGGLRFAGIGGSMHYNAGPEAYQYTEHQMERRLRHLAFKVRWAGGVEVMVSHAAPLHGDPAFDATDPAHRGCAAFSHFIKRHGPRYWLHGHNHLIYNLVPRVSRIAETVVINTYGHYLLDTEAPPPNLPIAADPTTLLRPS
jgi:Icc-related predicted phosphoesterase